MKEIYHPGLFSLSFLCHGSQIYHALLLTLEGMQNPIPTWGDQMSWINQNDTGVGATAPFPLKQTIFFVESQA